MASLPVPGCGAARSFVAAVSSDMHAADIRVFFAPLPPKVRAAYVNTYRCSSATPIPTRSPAYREHRATRRVRCPPFGNRWVHLPRLHNAAVEARARRPSATPTSTQHTCTGARPDRARPIPTIERLYDGHGGCAHGAGSGRPREVLSYPCVVARCDKAVILPTRPTCTPLPRSHPMGLKAYRFCQISAPDDNAAGRTHAPTSSLLIVATCEAGLGSLFSRPQSPYLRLVLGLIVAP
ncbi:hypothetical protein C8R45DRAFT_926656 [Mycena sanguinolenta]|nr:hypothetical protein C8R45DRAFT_926656 [Mycena sanguinolenta]